MALILGMSLGHDGSVAVVNDGRLVAAIATERLTRRKKAAGVTREAVNYVLRIAGATLDQVTHVAFAGYRYDPANEVKIYTVDGRTEIARNLFDIPFRKRALRFTVMIGDVAKPGLFVHHHLSHCASAYYTSPFDSAACFSLDSSMVRPEACSLFAYGQGHQLFPFYCPGLMIGNAYHVFTRKLGLGSGLVKAGSTMGLAAYGEPSQTAQARWQFFGESFYARQWMADDPTFIDFMWSELSAMPPQMSLAETEKDSQRAMNIAASLQFIFENVIVEYANKLFAETKTFNNKNLCLSGGSFLNCNVNTEVKKRTPFQRLHLFPACGDDGTAIGAALWVAHHLLNEPRATYSSADLAYLGCSYSDSVNGGSRRDLKAVAKVLSEGGIVAWFQGRAEFGPRALGNRSILANPRMAEMREIINKRIKNREWFRPLAPSVLAEASVDWFDFDGDSPFMLHTCRVKRQEEIPAVTHIDGTARQQTVRRHDNPVFYDLIAAFRDITGVPVVLNTSLNVNGEPLVETPLDALRFAKMSKVDLLVVNDRMFRCHELAL